MSETTFLILLFLPLLIPLLVLAVAPNKNSSTFLWKWFTGIVLALALLMLAWTYVESLQHQSALSGLGYLATAVFGYPALLIGVMGIIISNNHAKFVSTVKPKQPVLSLILVPALLALILGAIWMILLGR